VATLTRQFVDAIPAGSKLRIIDTRKTTPGLRIVERYAVRCGGGHNHRDSLGSAVLIKDNHIIAAGGIRAAIERVRQQAPHTSRIEVEVESLSELDEALAAGAEIVLLDNFDSAALKEAVTKARGRAIVEVSGGITLARVRELGELGVDVASVGALTHSAPAADIGSTSSVSNELRHGAFRATNCRSRARSRAPRKLARRDTIDERRRARGRESRRAARRRVRRRSAVARTRPARAANGFRRRAPGSGSRYCCGTTLNAEQAPGLALCAGLAVREAVASRVSAAVQVNGPNDVLAGGRKLAGILVESQLSYGKLGSVIVGIGINVTQTAFPEPIRDIATSLALLAATNASREQLLADVLQHFEASAHPAHPPRHAGHRRRAPPARRAIRSGRYALIRSKGRGAASTTTVAFSSATTPTSFTLSPCGHVQLLSC